MDGILAYTQNEREREKGTKRGEKERGRQEGGR